MEQTVIEFFSAQSVALNRGVWSWERLSLELVIAELAELVNVSISIEVPSKANCKNIG